jgi:hypothetical protein
VRKIRCRLPAAANLLPPLPTSATMADISVSYLHNLATSAATIDFAPAAACNCIFVL